MNFHPNGIQFCQHTKSTLNSTIFNSTMSVQYNHKRMVEPQVFIAQCQCAISSILCEETFRFSALYSAVSSKLQLKLAPESCYGIQVMRCNETNDGSWWSVEYSLLLPNLGNSCVFIVLSIGLIYFQHLRPMRNSGIGDRIKLGNFSRSVISENFCWYY
jgi:hypothetical protein